MKVLSAFAGCHVESQPFTAACFHLLFLCFPFPTHPASEPPVLSQLEVRPFFGQDFYPQKLWQAAEAYFESLDDAHMVLPGGRRPGGLRDGHGLRPAARCLLPLLGEASPTKIEKTGKKLVPLFEPL